MVLDCEEVEERGCEEIFVGEAIDSGASEGLEGGQT